MKPLSVIIVSWNACGFLQKCLSSLRQWGGSLVKEIIVIDNGSSDGSPEMVVREFPGVDLVQTGENLGFSRANNIGIKRASGAYLALINSDVVLHPGCFERLAEVIRADDDVGLVGPKVLDQDGCLQRTCRTLPTLWNTACRAFALDTAFPRWRLFSGREMRHWQHDNRAEVEVLSGCFWLARREAVEDVGGLDERFFFYGEDTDWCKRFGDAGWKVVFFPEATCTHFGGASSANAPLRFSVELLRANLVYWRKHEGALKSLTFRVLAIVHHSTRYLLLRGACAIGRHATREASYKAERSFVCTRWLLTGKSAQ